MTGIGSPINPNAPMPPQQFIDKRQDGALETAGVAQGLTEPRFKPGDEVFYPDFGCGTVLEVDEPYEVVVAFGKMGIRPLLVTADLRLSREEDKDWSPQSVPEPEPVCEPDEVTLENLEEAVSRWEAVATYIKSGFDDDPDEFVFDCQKREKLHGILHGFACRNLAVPDALKARIDKADQQFTALTFAIDDSVWGRGERYDKSVFWYYYRWPRK